jgi:hypothetical protein
MLMTGYLEYIFQTIFLGSLVHSLNIMQHVIINALFKKLSVPQNRIHRALLLEFVFALLGKG